jgi:hypothetical protein
VAGDRGNGGGGVSSLEATLRPFQPSRADLVIAREVDTIKRAGERMETTINVRFDQLDQRGRSDSRAIWSRLWWITGGIIAVEGTLIGVLVAFALR